MLKNNNKKLSFYILPFIISFILIVFVQSFNINSNVNLSLKYEKENAIFFDKSDDSENYISMRISRGQFFEIFMGRDTLPNFVKKCEESTIFKKHVKLIERNVREIISAYSILQRYKERILLI